MKREDLKQLSPGDLLALAAQLARADVDEDDESRWDAIGELWRRPEPDVFAQAVSWCRSADPRERCLGARVLSQLGPPSFPCRDDSTPVLVALLEDQDESVVVAALYACGHLAVGALDMLLAYCDHTSADVRLASVGALACRGEAGRQR